MKRPFILNERLNAIYKYEQNLYLHNKLKNAKPSIRINCPESFKFYKKTFGKSNKENLTKKLQIDVDNVILYNKLITIQSKITPKKMTSFEFKKDNMTGYRKKEIVNMAQENLHMFKRLKEKTSYYDFSKYDKEYDQAQYYKRSHCSLLPSIDFNRNKRSVSFGSKNRTLYNSIFNINNSNSFNNINISKSNNLNSTRYNNSNRNNKTTEQNLFINNLYKKTLEELKYEDFLENKTEEKKEQKINEKIEEEKNEKIEGGIQKKEKENEKNKKKKETNNKNEKKLILKIDSEEDNEQSDNKENSENNKNIKI